MKFLWFQSLLWFYEIQCFRQWFRSCEIWKRSGDNCLSETCWLKTTWVDFENFLGCLESLRCLLKQSQVQWTDSWQAKHAISLRVRFWPRSLISLAVVYFWVYSYLIILSKLSKISLGSFIWKFFESKKALLAVERTSESITLSRWCMG